MFYFPNANSVFFLTVYTLCGAPMDTLLPLYLVLLCRSLQFDCFCPEVHLELFLLQSTSTQ